LLAARRESRPSLRWAHWIMAFTGMRAGEVLQLIGADVQREGPVWFLDIHEDTAGNSVKNGRRRRVPIHPALLAEGFITFAEKVAAGEPLFPDKRPDKFGQQGGRAWNVVGKWVRQTVGIEDPRKAPDHSWRHRMEDELRAVEAPEDARDAILGHARKTTGRVYGVRGEALARLHRFLSMIPAPPGLSKAATDKPAA
jgi:integrase